MDTIIKMKGGREYCNKIITSEVDAFNFPVLCEVSGMSWRKIEGILVVGWGKSRRYTGMVMNGVGINT